MISNSPSSAAAPSPNSYYFPVLVGRHRWRATKVWLVEPSAERREKAAATVRLPARPAGRRHFRAAGHGHRRGQRHAQPFACRDHASADRARRQRDRRKAARRDGGRCQAAGRRSQGPLRAHGKPVSPLLPVLPARAGTDRRPAKSARFAEYGGRKARNSNGRRSPVSISGGPWKTGRPRGVLLDIGVHVLDVVCWWLGEAPRVLSASMDGYGGPECFARAGLAVRRRRDRSRRQLPFEARERICRRGHEGGDTRLGDGLRHDRNSYRFRQLAVEARTWTGRLDRLRRRYC